MIDSLDDDLGRLAGQNPDRDLGGLEHEVARRVSAWQAARARASAARPFTAAAVLVALTLGLVAGGGVPRNRAEAADFDVFSTDAHLAPSTLLGVSE